MVTKLKKLYTELIVDEVSWFVHWVICMGGSLAVAAFLGPKAGLGASEIFLGYFCFREGLNYATHKYEDPHGMGRWTRDGILDLTGPVLNAVLWWGVILYV